MTMMMMMARSLEHGEEKRIDCQSRRNWPKTLKIEKKGGGHCEEKKEEEEEESL